MSDNREHIKAREEARDTYWSVYDEATHACPDCGEEDVPFEVHHIDFDPFNNEIDNLVGLCHSCHRGRHRRVDAESRLESMREEYESITD